MAERVGEAADQVASPGHAQRILEANRRIQLALGSEHASPAMLDILLFLAAEEGEDGVTTSRCCAALPVPRTTALRWIASLVAAGAVEQLPIAEDGRVTLLRLSPAARTALRSWMSAIAA